MPKDSPSKRKAACLSPYSKKLTASSESKDSVGLDLFGIKATGDSKNKDRDSLLKACILETKNGASIVFRCEPKDSAVSSWSEKVFCDAVKSGEKWARKLNFRRKFLKWFQDNEPVQNAGGYDIRMLVIDCDERPAKDSVIGLAEFVAGQINSAPGNRCNLSVDKKNFFWLPDDAVWSDIIGVDQALEDLIDNAGSRPEAGFYDKHKDLIHKYFAPETFALDLARALHAPLDQVHPDLREDLKVGKTSGLEDDLEDGKTTGLDDKMQEAEDAENISLHKYDSDDESENQDDDRD